MIIQPNDSILVTGATGFIGSRLVALLLDQGFRNLVCLVRPTSDVSALETAASSRGLSVSLVRGNLLSLDDCVAATRDIKVMFHLAAGGGAKSFPDSFMNCVVTTRNLLEASRRHACLRRFVNVSSFAVYDNRRRHGLGVLDERCPIEPHPHRRGDAYTYAKVKQDEVVVAYCSRYDIPYVIVRPGSVYGRGKAAIPARVGIDTFGVFLHLGGANRVPFTHVDNCANAIVLAGITDGIDGEVFNVVDDDLPTSREFLRAYKRNAHRFRSIYIPHFMSYVLCALWERYSEWSEGQLRPAFNRSRWNALWRSTEYSNQKLKLHTGWVPKVTAAVGFDGYFRYCREKGQHA